jgi:hypothetical protein
VQFPDGSAAPVHDLYSFQVTPGVYWISVEPTDPNAPGDLDLYLFFSNVNPNVVPLAQVPRFSLNASSHELIGVRFGGTGTSTFLIGVSAFAGDVKYKLRLLPEPPLNKDHGGSHGRTRISWPRNTLNTRISVYSVFSVARISMSPVDRCTSC